MEQFLSESEIREREKNEMIRFVKGLHLTPGEYVVVGSAAMQLHECRAARDVDILVSKQEYDRLKESGWEEVFYDEEKELKMLTNGYVELFYDLNYKGGVEIDYYKNNDEGRERINDIGGVSVMSLRDLYDYKGAKQSEKDIRDMELIRQKLDSLES